MTILVTGGAGFIGSHFIRYILNKYHSYKIINLDKLTYAANLKNLFSVKDNSRYRFIKADICDRKVLEKIIKLSDVVVNFAASTHVDRAILKPDEFIRTNIYGTYVLLELARRYRIKRFVQISTDEVYGSIREGFADENFPLNPSNPYSASKASADHLARAYFLTYSLDVVITRSSNNFGPNQYPDKIIPLFIMNALKGERLPLYAKGLNKRDWLFVLDNCSAIDIVLHKGKSGEVYNISAGNELTNLELSRLILKKLNKPLSLIKYVKDRPGHDFRYAMDSGKVKALGWRPQFRFESALDITIEWYRNNPNYFKK
ncbi:MAG: dTDP-glucose 4,6-dehydratase [Candidatus Omnitrophica bacterium]|nr:dTDP-glucose 4,6-dehydratase [Candidatus Omnitrophota bacterium]